MSSINVDYVSICEVPDCEAFVWIQDLPDSHVKDINIFPVHWKGCRTHILEWTLQKNISNWIEWTERSVHRCYCDNLIIDPVDYLCATHREEYDS